MAGTAVRVIFSNPQHGWNEESTSSEILGDSLLPLFKQNQENLSHFHSLWS